MGNKYKRLIFEGSRDNALNKYCQLVKAATGLEISIGQFKSKLLNKLGVEGGLSNLSMRSNYYLAGAARYYFDNELTNNDDLSLLKKETWESNAVISDDWRTEICEKLNKIILFLRESYIDSVGQTWLQPEDFGEMPIKTLIATYKKIFKKSSKPKNELSSEEFNSKDVGNDYTFEIMYSFEDCEKYYQPTNPGSWCITYGKQWYNNYQKSLKIHYVIFRKNGWEDIPRPKDPLNEPGFTPQKPHDAFGNSLIAVLQSNNSPEPVYITSRWNHGYEAHCEADHAYTKEEFQQITGVTDDDLKRIYDIWKSHKKTGRSKKEVSQQFQQVIRALKYAQIRINSGENIEQLLHKEKVIVGNENLKKSISVCSINEMPDIKFLVDRGKIVFETATDASETFQKIGNLILVKLPKDKENCLYCIQTHSIVSVGGVKIFKYMPIFTIQNGYVSMNDRYYSYNIEEFLNNIDSSYEWIEVKQGRYEACLINTKTGKPLTLPNGSYWYNQSKSCDNSRYENGNYVYGHLYRNSIIELIYDLSSGEKYFYLGTKNKFIDIPRNDDETYYSRQPQLGNVDNRCPNGVFSIYYPGNGSIIYYNEDILQYKKLTRFSYATAAKNSDILALIVSNDIIGKIPNVLGWKRNYALFDIATKSFIGTPEGNNDIPLLLEDIDIVEDMGYIKGFDRNVNAWVFFDYNKKCFIKTPYDDGSIYFNLEYTWGQHGRETVCYKTSDNGERTQRYSFYENRPDDEDLTNLQDITTGYVQPILLPNGTTEDGSEINETIRIGLNDIKTMVNEVISRLMF